MKNEESKIIKISKKGCFDDFFESHDINNHEWKADTDRKRGHIKREFSLSQVPKYLFPAYKCVCALGFGFLRKDKVIMLSKKTAEYLKKNEETVKELFECVSELNVPENLTEEDLQNFDIVEKIDKGNKCYIDEFLQKLLNFKRVFPTIPKGVKVFEEVNFFGKKEFSLETNEESIFFPGRDNKEAIEIVSLQLGKETDLFSKNPVRKVFFQLYNWYGKDRYKSTPRKWLVFRVGKEGIEKFIPKMDAKTFRSTWEIVEDMIRNRIRTGHPCKKGTEEDPLMLCDGFDSWVTALDVAFQSYSNNNIPFISPKTYVEWGITTKNDFRRINKTHLFKTNQLIKNGEREKLEGKISDINCIGEKLQHHEWEKKLDAVSGKTNDFLALINVQNVPKWQALQFIWKRESGGIREKIFLAREINDFPNFLLTSSVETIPSLQELGEKKKVFDKSRSALPSNVKITNDNFKVVSQYIKKLEEEKSVPYPSMFNLCSFTGTGLSSGTVDKWHKNLKTIEDFFGLETIVSHKLNFTTGKEADSVESALALIKRVETCKLDKEPLIKLLVTLKREEWDAFKNFLITKTDVGLLTKVFDVQEEILKEGAFFEEIKQQYPYYKTGFFSGEKCFPRHILFKFIRANITPKEIAKFLAGRSIEDFYKEDGLFNKNLFYDDYQDFFNL